MPDITPTAELDCRGMSCPLPVLKTKKAIAKLASGDVLRVIATDPTVVADMVALSRYTGNELIEQTEDAGEFVFLFRKA